MRVYEGNGSIIGGNTSGIWMPEMRGLLDVVTLQ